MTECVLVRNVDDNQITEYDFISIKASSFLYSATIVLNYILLSALDLRKHLINNFTTCRSY